METLLRETSVETGTAIPGQTPTTVGKSVTRQQIRGSSLLVVGQVLAKGINFIIQVMIVRYLTKSDYGAFAYALSMEALGETIVTFGLNRTAARFLPIFQEKGDYNRLFGTLFMVIGSICSLGLAFVLVFYGFQGLIRRWWISDPMTLSLLLILVLLSPINAMSNLVNDLFAVFSRPRAIFFRKYVIGPVLELAVVVMLVIGRSNAQFLAAGYVVANFLGVAIFTQVLVQVLRKQKLFQHLSMASIKVPWRELLTFSIPLMSLDLVNMVMNTTDAMLLGHFHGTVAVATLRSIQPTARLNQIILQTFGVLFTPAAARLFARNDREGVNHLYWSTAAWISVISFPIFAFTFSLARPITLLLFTDRYAESAILLALLSFGYYFNAITGQNGMTLRVYGKIRYSVYVDVFTAVFNFCLNLVLIPRFSALGAAIGNLISMVLYNVLKQAGLKLNTGINLFNWNYLRLYASISLGAIILMGFGIMPWVPIYVDILLAGIVSFLVFWLNRRVLNIEQTFPELLRFPLIRRLLVLGEKHPSGERENVP